MPLYLLVMSGAGFLTAALVPLIKRVAMYFGAVDFPIERRRIHKEPIPRLGGATIFFGTVLSSAFGLLFVVEEGRSLASPEILGLFVGCVCVFFIGLYDDVRGASAFVKLAVQIVAATFLYWTGSTIGAVDTPFGFSVILGVLDFPLTLLWIIGLTNGMNLLDGIDGLAAGVGAMAALTIVVVGMGRDNVLVAVVAAALLGSLLGFLFFNFHPASIFLGDCGALFLGFALAALPLIGNQKTATAVVLLVPLIALGVPIFDTTLAVVRRMVRGTHPFQPDRRHVHHQLFASGLSQRQVALALYAVSALLSVMAIVMTKASRSGALAILFLLAVAAIVSLQHLGAEEVKMFWGVLRYGERRRHPPKYRSLVVRNSVPLLARCRTDDELREVLEEIRRCLDYDVLSMSVDTGVAGFSLIRNDEYSSRKTLPGDRLTPQPFDRTHTPWTTSIEIPCGMRNQRRRGMNDSCCLHGTCGAEIDSCGNGGRRILGTLYAERPSWKRRRAGESDEELLALVAEGLGAHLTDRMKDRLPHE